MSILFYEYAACSTCKNAKTWLRNHGIDIPVIPIVERPPSAAELKKFHRASGLPIKKFFNTSGLSYRALSENQKPDRLSDDECYALLARDGKLIKRPILVDGTQVLVGFSESVYAAHFRQ
ncbi:MAG TPA: arsenate reductase family protein [Bdellovibrionota bacterium]|jgi:arsenate reductase|nr:arsenate reductase family protein [Bdellovibrionota bacterium]